MLSAEKTPAEIEAANCYHAYRDGWRAGAATRAMEPRFVEHMNPGIRVAYATG